MVSGANLKIMSASPACARSHLTELAWLSNELRENLDYCPFRFEWSNHRQGHKLLIGGDWNRRLRHTTRTIQGVDGKPIRKAGRPLSTLERQLAIAEGIRLVKSWHQGCDTRQRRRPSGEPYNILLAHQRRVASELIRQRSCGTGRKRKLLRHTLNLYSWLDQRGLPLDCSNAIAWAADGVSCSTANYADRLFCARSAVELNALRWDLPKHRRPKTPKVRREFAENALDSDVEQVFSLIKDPQVEAFCRVIAATGCRPSEVVFFDWFSWLRADRQMPLYGWSPKVDREFIAVCHPLAWLKDLDPSLLRAPGLDWQDRSRTEQSSRLNTQYSARLLRLMKRDLQAAGFKPLPRWTDLRHLWTLRALAAGMDRKTAALAQAHSERMAELVYLRHGEKRQSLAGIERFAKLMLAKR